MWEPLLCALAVLCHAVHACVHKVVAYWVKGLATAHCSACLWTCHKGGVADHGVCLLTCCCAVLLCCAAVTGVPKVPVYWGYTVPSLLLTTIARIVQHGRLVVVFDLDETLLLASTKYNLKQRLESVSKKV